MIEIKHEISNVKAAYDDEVIQLYIDLPNGMRLYFADRGLHWLDDPEECAEKYKLEIYQQLGELKKLLA